VITEENKMLDNAFEPGSTKHCHLQAICFYLQDLQQTQGHDYALICVSSNKLFLQILRIGGWKNKALHINECWSAAEVFRATKMPQHQRRWMTGTSYYFPINKCEWNYINLYFKVAGDKHKHDLVPRRCKQCTKMSSYRKYAVWEK
jgi:hypothetical protein